jgi:hypothetical protein
MVAATDEEMKTSLAAHEELRCEGKRIYFADPQAPSITVDLRVKEPHQLVYLARLIAHIGYDEIDFRGAYLWVTTRGVWNPLEEALGLKTLEQFRRSYGENRSLEAASGHYFRDDEFTESVCCLLQPMIVGWDSHYVPLWAYGHLDYFVSVSHDGFIDIEVRTQETRDRILGILRNHEWMATLLKSRERQSP